MAPKKNQTSQPQQTKVTLSEGAKSNAIVPKYPPLEEPSLAEQRRDKPIVPRPSKYHTLVFEVAQEHFIDTGLKTYLGNPIKTMSRLDFQKNFDECFSYVRDISYAKNPVRANMRHWDREEGRKLWKFRDSEDNAQRRHALDKLERYHAEGINKMLNSSEDDRKKFIRSCYEMPEDRCSEELDKLNKYLHDCRRIPSKYHFEDTARRLVESLRTGKLSDFDAVWTEYEKIELVGTEEETVADQLAKMSRLRDQIRKSDPNQNPNLEKYILTQIKKLIPMSSKAYENDPNPKLSDEERSGLMLRFKQPYKFTFPAGEPGTINHKYDDDVALFHFLIWEKIPDLSPAMRRSKWDSMYKPLLAANSIVDEILTERLTKPIQDLYDQHMVRDDLVVPETEPVVIAKFGAEIDDLIEEKATKLVSDIRCKFDGADDDPSAEGITLFESGFEFNFGTTSDETWKAHQAKARLLRTGEKPAPDSKQYKNWAKRHQEWQDDNLGMVRARKFRLSRPWAQEVYNDDLHYYNVKYQRLYDRALIKEEAGGERAKGKRTEGGGEYPREADQEGQGQRSASEE